MRVEHGLNLVVHRHSAVVHVRRKVEPCSQCSWQFGNVYRLAWPTRLSVSFVLSRVDHFEQRSLLVHDSKLNRLIRASET
jgi:hypothetical protein